MMGPLAKKSLKQLYSHIIAILKQRSHAIAIVPTITHP